MKDILIFSHNYLTNNWFEIVNEQLNLLFKSGLYDAAIKIYYCAYAEEEFQIYRFINLIEKIDLQKKVNITIFPTNDREKPTIVLLQEICKSYEDAYVLYYHTKGVSSTNRFSQDIQKNIDSWRNLMNYFNIERWQHSVEALDVGHDICGVLYGNFTISGTNGNPDRHRAFYAGNFWWATSKYINKLRSAKSMDSFADIESFITSTDEWRWANAGVYIATHNIYEVYFDPDTYRVKD